MSHPHDVALLYDLLDGRLGTAAAKELRQRLADEPELRATWDELGRLRRALGALPTAAPPADFGRRVRERIGVPMVEEGSIEASTGEGTSSISRAPEGAVSRPGVPGVDLSESGDPQRDPQGDPHRNGHVSPVGLPPSGPVPATPVLRILPRGWLAAAAVALAAVGAAILATRSGLVERRGLEVATGNATAPTGAAATAHDSPGLVAHDPTVGFDASKAKKEVGTFGARAPEEGGLETATAEALRPGAPGPAPASPPPAAATPQGPFRSPGGAIPPGLREPSDVPAPPPPRPVPGTWAPPTATPEPGMPPPAPSPSRPVAPLTAGGVAAPWSAEGDGEDTAEDAKSADDPSRERGLARPAFAWARDGVDEVLVLRAATYDEARAQVGLLDAALRQTVALPSLQLERLDDATRGPSLGGGGGQGAGGPSALGPAPGLVAGATDSSGGAQDGRRVDGADGSPTEPKGAARTAAPQALLALGSFVLEDLDGERFGRLAELTQVVTGRELEARQGSLRDATTEEVASEAARRKAGEAAPLAEASPGVGGAPAAPAAKARGVVGAGRGSPDKDAGPEGSPAPTSPTPVTLPPAASGPPPPPVPVAPPPAAAPSALPAPLPVREEPAPLRRVRIVVLPR